MSLSGIYFQLTLALWKHTLSDLGLLWGMTVTATMTTVSMTMVTAIKSTEHYVADTGLSPSHPFSHFKFTAASLSRTMRTPMSQVIRPHSTQAGSHWPWTQGFHRRRGDLPRKHRVGWPGFCRGRDFRFWARAPWRSRQWVVRRPGGIRKYFPCWSQEMLFIFNFFFPGLGFVFRQEEVKLLLPAWDCPPMA